MTRYSLADYILSIKSSNQEINSMFGTLAIGGEGTAIGSISLSLTNALYSTETYSTGAWIHNKNLSRSGNVSVTLNQLADQIPTLKRLVNLYYNGVGSSIDQLGLTLSVVDTLGNEIASCIDCFPTKIPDQNFNREAEDQTWVFTAGKITFD